MAAPATLTTSDRLLESIFGFPEFRPGQLEVIEALLDGRSALAVFPTGGGKSLCYQLPALQLEGLTLVVSPLIALMKDQIDFLRSKGVAAERLDSTLSAEEARDIAARMTSGEIKLLYVAPERFNNERFLAQLKRVSISLMAIDEAHCISEWGHNFRPDYLKLAQIAGDLEAERVLALTATATPKVVESIRAAFGIAEADAVVTGFYRPNLTLLTTPVTAAERDAALLERLKTRPAGPTIVYVTLQKTAENVASSLSENGLPARAYHAGMDPEVRAEVQDWWMAGHDRVVVATIAFGMGIDKASVRYVYHYNLPKSLESYSQEIGRAGRDGLPSVVELLACRDDLPPLENFAYGDTPTRESLKSLLRELLTSGETIVVDQYDLSNRHDLRPLVLKTALTYLELLGALKQGTPVYTGYEFKPLVPVPEIYNAFPGEPGVLVRQLFEKSKHGRIWNSLNPEEMARKLGQERKRIVRALEVMSEKALVELRSSDVRTPYTLLEQPLTPVKILDELVHRFETREAQEIGRLRQVLELVEQDGCQVAALTGHFGEMRAEPCGHCTYCLSREQQVLPNSYEPEVECTWGNVVGLVERIPEERRSARFLARLLCGLGSPAMTRAKLTKDPMFGSLERVPFAKVLAWCEQGMSAK